MSKYYSSYGVDKHANARDRKRDNSRKMVVTNRSINTIADIINQRAEQAKRGKINKKGRQKRGYIESE